MPVAPSTHSLFWFCGALFIVGAFLARGMDVLDALVAAVYLHGSAGDLAAARLGEESLIASDVIDALPDAFAALRG